MKRFNFKSAIIAGFIATVVMTIFMAFFDMNIVKVLGMAMGKTGVMAYIFGGVIHLVVGLIYGLIYGLIIQPIFSKLPGFLSGSIYGVIIFIIALIFSPLLMKTLHGWGGKKGMATVSATSYRVAYTPSPCAPTQYGQDQAEQYSQYGQDQADQYAQQGQEQVEQYGKQPGQQQYDQYGRPVQPNQGQQYDQYGRPVQPSQGQANPNQNMQPKEPNYNNQSHSVMHQTCSYKKSSLPNWLWTLFNHLVYGFVLGVFYRPRKVDEQKQDQ